MKLPRELILLVTNQCNSRCTICNIWREKPAKDLESRFYQNLPSSLRKISISGGEPFLREDLVDIIRILNKNNPRFVISTNGLAPELIKKRLKEILKITKKVGIRVSVDGIGKAHDNIRGVHGSFKRALKTIEICKEMGIKDLGLFFIMQDKNLDELKNVYFLSRKLRISFGCCPVDNSYSYKKYDNKLTKIGKIRTNLNFLIRNELKSNRSKSWFKSFFYYGMYFYLQERIKQKKGMVLNCTGLRKFFLLDADGRIFPCTITNKSVGNIKKDKFNKIWKSKKAQDLRNFIKDCPTGCWTACNVNTSIRANIFKSAFWILTNKIKLHLGIRNFLGK